VVKGTVRSPVASAGEAVAHLLAGRCGDRGGPAQRSKRCCGSQFFGVVSGGCQERDCGDDADATEREQDRVENPDKEFEVAFDDPISSRRELLVVSLTRFFTSPVRRSLS
jgi:hypothetical protein